MTQKRAFGLRPFSQGIEIVRRKEPHVLGLRFPNFRNFAADAQIHFTFPISVIFGRNGTNKSSLLHALYGAPRRKTVADFWFTTSLDGIPEADAQGLKPSVVHWYKDKKKEVVYCIKARAPRGTSDPDYWEAVKPTEPYGFPPGAKRASPIDIDVLHLDFRGLLPAFDRYLYFPSPQHLKQRDASAKASGTLRRDYRPQDYLRMRTQGLREKVMQEGTRFSDVELQALSYVLDREYTAGTLLEHSRFHGHRGTTIVFQTKHLEQGYSEAFAGSGESAAAMLIHMVERAKAGSLILLDEPETSLHARAQRRMLEFLVDRAGRRDLQIVLATHSIEFARELPREAIHLLQHNADGKVEVVSRLSANEAAHDAATIPAGRTVLVEDARAAKILREELSRQSPLVAREFHVVVRPGGVSQIYHDIRAYSGMKDKALHVVLDGDQRPDDPIPAAGSLPSGLDELKAIIRRATRGNDQSGPELAFVSAEQAREFALFLRERTFYLPGRTPEALVWNDDAVKDLLRAPVPAEIASEADPKRRISLLAGRVAGLDEEAVFSNLLRSFLEGSSSDLKELVALVSRIRNST